MKTYDRKKKKVIWTVCGCGVTEHEEGSCKNIEGKNSVAEDDIELQARKIVRKGAREASYGEPGKDFKRTAMMWNGYLREKLHTDITSEDVACMMVMLKLSRLAETPHHHDSKVDAIGYMICYDRLKD